MLFKVLKYDVFCNGTVGRREVSAPPKAPGPIPALQLWELALDLVGGSPLHQPHQVTDGKFRRHRHEGAVRRIRTSLSKDSKADPYAVRILRDSPERRRG